MLLAAAYGSKELSIEPDVACNIPLAKKRGRPYSMDCLVAEYKEEESDENTMVIIKEKDHKDGGRS